VIFNDVVLQASIATLPFGGVGASGMGRGHGRQGFETFSNQRSILKRRFGFDLPFRYPPYGNRLRWLRFFLD
jgi:aldehyde dehydrogenase (NAD+)